MIIIFIHSYSKTISKGNCKNMVNRRIHVNTFGQKNLC
jgi:hypothetical protein